MYYRRKILLSILQIFENELQKLALQKLLFLFVQAQNERAVYHFVPYKYGCFSFQANADLRTLCKYGIVQESENTWIKRGEDNYIVALKKTDHLALQYIYNKFRNSSVDELIQLTYEKYPYFATKSTIADKYLTKSQMADLVSMQTNDPETVLFTIGYEGISLEEYLNKLIRNNVNVLCDVRKNPLSMKYGFSKTQLQNACQGIGIEYVHFPKVGIDSKMRQNLNTQNDYDKLFADYTKNTLSTTNDIQSAIFKLLKTKRRIALTCFEANINQCHRKHLAESITRFPGFKYGVKHI